MRVMRLVAGGEELRCVFGRDGMGVRVGGEKGGGTGGG